MRIFGKIWKWLFWDIRSNLTELVILKYKWKKIAVFGSEKLLGTALTSLLSQQFDLSYIAAWLPSPCRLFHSWLPFYTLCEDLWLAQNLLAWQCSGVGKLSWGCNVLSKKQPNIPQPIRSKHLFSLTWRRHQPFDLLLNWSWSKGSTTFK